MTKIIDFPMWQYRFNFEYFFYQQDQTKKTRLILKAVLNWNNLLHTVWSSRQEVFYKKGVFKNFAKFTGKYLCQSLFFIDVVGWGLQLY